MEKVGRIKFGQTDFMTISPLSQVGTRKDSLNYKGKLICILKSVIRLSFILITISYSNIS